MVAYRKQEKPMPEIDDGWWDSVLAEEERYVAPVIKQTNVESSVKGEDPKQSPDWNEVRDLYHEDRIVDLTVTGYNRGGVLVEGEGLYGFVPYSHLVEMAASPEKQNREDGLDSYIGRTLRLKVINVRLRMVGLCFRSAQRWLNRENGWICSTTWNLERPSRERLPI
jgi:small subunit ribosomal protein S1